MSARTVEHQNSAHTRSVTTFNSGALLTIATNISVTLTIRHPHTVPIRRAESRAKALLATLSETALPPRHTLFHRLLEVLLLLCANVVTLVPIAVHVLHENELVTILAHVPAALGCLFVHYLLTVVPHKAYLAVTPTHLVYRPRGLLSTVQKHPLSVIRDFSQDGNLILADTVSPNVSINAPDKQTASAAVQALNTALRTRERVRPPDTLLDTPGETIIESATPLCEYDLPCERLDIRTIGDRVRVSTTRPTFPRVLPILVGFLVSHALAVVLLLFVFEDLPRSVDPITGGMIAALALAGFYGSLVLGVLIWYLVRCIPKKWNLIVLGYRKDVTSGIDVGKCREVVLFRKKNAYGVRVVSSTGSNFLNVGGLTEGEAAKLILALRATFPSLFPESV